MPEPSEVNVASIASKLRSIASAIEENPTKFQEIAATIGTQPSHFKDLQAATQNIIAAPPAGPTIQDVDWQEIGFVIVCVILA